MIGPYGDSIAHVLVILVVPIQHSWSTVILSHVAILDRRGENMCQVVKNMLQIIEYNTDKLG